MGLNCWEVKKCERELNGSKVNELGICPVSTEERLSGVHEGINAGRACWVVAGSLCNGEVQGTFAKKARDCYKCDFYKQVQEEQKGDFHLTPVLLNMLKT